MTSSDPWVPTPMTITAVRRELAETVSLTLDPGPAGRPFEPGQFNMLWRFGHGEVAISISGDPADPRQLIHTLRGVGSVTRPLLDSAVGDVLGVRGPFGRPWPVAQARGGDLLLVAGGIGLAPLRPALLWALAHRAQFGRLILLVGAREPASLLFAEQLDAWGVDPRLELQVAVDKGAPGWTGPVGVVTRLMPGLNLDPGRSTVMTCGPEIMMRFVAQEAVKAGIPASRIHLSMERNMHCAVGLCGRCQWGPDFVCKDGPVFVYEDIVHRLAVRER